MNKRPQPPLWLIAIVLPPIVSAILGAIYDWEIAGAAALLGLLILPATLLFAAPVAGGPRPPDRPAKRTADR